MMKYLLKLKNTILFKPAILTALILASSFFSYANGQTTKQGNQNTKILNVVTTLPDYACIAKAIGKNRVKVTNIVTANQDAHFIRPKPSFIRKAAMADLLIATGLDLELWLPSVVNISGNRHIASGQSGYVAAARGMTMLEVPQVISRSEGGLHLFGNPHVTTSPVNMRVAAKNILKGLIANAPQFKQEFEQAAKDYINKLDVMLYGSKLVKLLGGDTLSRLAEQDKLITFLKSRKLNGTPLIDILGGAMKKAMPLRGIPIVTYHKNWVYFNKLLGLKPVGTLEPKPGIPPSAKHKLEIINIMKTEKVKLILSANYFNDRLCRSIAKQTGAKAVIVPVYCGGTNATRTYCDLFNYWIDELLARLQQTDKLN